MRLSLLLGLSVLAACDSPPVDPSLTENHVQLEWNRGETFYVGASYKRAMVKRSIAPTPLVVGADVTPYEDEWSDEAVWAYQVVEEGMVPSEDDELYPYAVTQDGDVASLSVLRAYLDKGANIDTDLLEADPVVYLVFRDGRDRLAAIVAFIDVDGERTQFAVSTTDLDKSWDVLSQSMLTDVPTFLAPFTATYADADATLENGSVLNTRAVDSDVVDTYYDDELGGGLVISRYERGQPWPTRTVSDNLDSRLLSAEEVNAYRLSRRGALYRMNEAPEDFDYKAALRSTIDIDGSLTLDDETMSGGWTSFVYDEFTPWAGQWWPLKGGHLVFGYEGRKTFSELLRADIDPIATRKDELSTQMKGMDKDDPAREALVTEYRAKHDELVEKIVAFYNGFRDDFDGGKITVADGKISHSEDGWSYEVDTLSPFDKFGLTEYLRGTEVSNPFFVSAWELLNQYNPGGESWWGHCNGWAAAAIGAHEPRESETWTHTTGDVTFDPGDIKGLLSASYYSTASTFYGQRYNGEDDDITDLRPEAFHNIINFYLRTQKVPFVFDTTASEAVWNYPVTGVKVSVDETTDPNRPAGLVNINTASLKTIDSLKGVNWAMASAIYMHRKWVGTFQTIDDIDKVWGVDRDDIAKFKDQVTVTATERKFAVSAAVTFEDDAVDYSHVSDPASPTTFVNTYEYELVTDEHGVVMGGTWKDESHHPDFAWVPYENPKVRSNGGSENPFLSYQSILDVFGEDLERR